MPKKELKNMPQKDYNKYMSYLTSSIYYETEIYDTIINFPEIPPNSLIGLDQISIMKSHRIECISNINELMSLSMPIAETQEPRFIDMAIKMQEVVEVLIRSVNEIEKRFFKIQKSCKSNRDFDCICGRCAV